MLLKKDLQGKVEATERLIFRRFFTQMQMYLLRYTSRAMQEGKRWSHLTWLFFVMNCQFRPWNQLGKMVP